MTGLPWQMELAGWLCIAVIAALLVLVWHHERRHDLDADHDQEQS